MKKCLYMQTFHVILLHWIVLHHIVTGYIIPYYQYVHCNKHTILYQCELSVIIKILRKDGKGVKL